MGRYHHESISDQRKPAGGPVHGNSVGRDDENAAGSTYWNQVHGFTAEDVKKDLEGLQTMRNLARNMAFLMKAIADAREKYGLPKQELDSFTSFPDGK